MTVFVHHPQIRLRVRIPLALHSSGTMLIVLRESTKLYCAMEYLAPHLRYHLTAL